MLIGDVHYITSSYNGVKFEILLENHLKKKRNGEPLSEELFEECLAAFLEHKDSKVESVAFSKMESYINTCEIKYSDCRSYTQKSAVGNPYDAIKAFNKLYGDFLLKQKRNV